MSCVFGLYSLFLDVVRFWSVLFVSGWHHAYDSFAVLRRGATKSLNGLRPYSRFCILPGGTPWTPFDLTLLRLPPSALDPETWRSLGDSLASRPGDCAPDGTLTNNHGDSYERDLLRGGEDNQFRCREFRSVFRGQDPPEDPLRPWGAFFPIDFFQGLGIRHGFSPSLAMLADD